MSMNPLYITEQGQLETLCATLSTQKPSLLSVDTEFIRKTTYWPKLCLIQLAFDDQIVLIDPLPNSLSLAPLKEVFLDPKILKIFHAARQDLEVFFLLWDAVPYPIADTQILAMVCGFGDSISYDKLSESLTGNKVDKSQQHTDWAQRPLSSKQVTYAMGDVEHLQEIYAKLLERAGPKIEYIQDELDLLKSPDLYRGTPEKVWLKIKAPIPPSPQIQGVLKELAAVREVYAQSKNMPRAHLIKDELLVQMASKSSLADADLQTFGVKDPAFREALLKAAAIAVPLKRQNDFKSKPSGVLVDLLSILLKMQSEHHGIAPKLIATRDKMDAFLENPHTSPLMQGWRLSLFGENALKIIQGKTALAFDQNTKQPIFVDLPL